MESSQAGNFSSFVNVSNSPSEEFSIFSENASFMLENDTPTYSSNDTLSFVVLQSAVASYIDIDQKSKSIDSSSLIQSLNSSEIHEKLSELLQENMKLKETLKQNNIAMKQQFNILASWKEKMTKVQENHKHKFQETLELVRHQIKCAMEDASLKSYDMPSVSEVQNPKSFSILDVSHQETEELCNSTQKNEKLSTDFNEQLSVQDNQLGMTKSDQKTEAASTIQSAIESPLLGEFGLFCSGYFDQSTTLNTPKHVETVNTCPNCYSILTAIESPLLEEFALLCSDYFDQSTPNTPEHVETVNTYPNCYSIPTAIESPLLEEFGLLCSDYFDESTTPNTPEHVETVNTYPNCYSIPTATESPLLEEFGLRCSDYFDQSTTPNTPEHVETVNTCPNCVKCALKDEEIEALKETVVQLEHRLQSAIYTEDNILRTTLLNQQMYVESLESKLEKWEEYKILSETQLAAYEEDFQLERRQNNVLKEENNRIYENLIRKDDLDAVTAMRAFTSPPTDSDPQNEL